MVLVRSGRHSINTYTTCNWGKMWPWQLNDNIHKDIWDPQQGDIVFVLGQLRAPGAKKAGWMQGWDEGSRGCRFLKQYLCHRLPEWMSFWSSSGVQVETRGRSTCTRPWTRDQGLLLAVSISNKIRRKATGNGGKKLLDEWSKHTGWLTKFHIFAVQWVKLLCFSVRHDLSCSTTGEATTAATWLLTVWPVSGCREAGCFGIQKMHLLGASVSRLKISKARRLSTMCCMSFCYVTKLWILIDWAAWNSRMDLIPVISLELKMTNAMTLGLVSLASALYNDVPKAGV